MLYAIRAIGTEFIKFGVTSGSCEKRLRFLQCGCPFELKLEAYCLGGRELETAIHYRLCKAKAWHRGEWFRDCDEARKIIAEMNADLIKPIPEASANDVRLNSRHKRLGNVLEFANRKAGQWGR